MVLIHHEKKAEDWNVEIYLSFVLLRSSEGWDAPMPLYPEWANYNMPLLRSYIR